MYKLCWMINVASDISIKMLLSRGSGVFIETRQKNSRRSADMINIQHESF